MVVHIQSGKHMLKADLSAKIQSMPFKIHADADAKVTKYFNQYIKENENGVLTASFRGYPLKGKVLELPEGYTGLVLHESIKPVTDREDRKFYVVHDFDSIVHWNWDKTPSKNDALDQALTWIDIAEALHSPITED